MELWIDKSSPFLQSIVIIESWFRSYQKTATSKDIINLKTLRMTLFETKSRAKNKRLLKE